MVKRLNESNTRANEVAIIEKAVSDLKDAFVKCAESFDQVDIEFLNEIISPEYPFDKDFDELVFDVLMWKDDCYDRLDKETIKAASEYESVSRNRRTK